MTSGPTDLAEGNEEWRDKRVEIHPRSDRAGNSLGIDGSMISIYDSKGRRVEQLDGTQCGPVWLVDRPWTNVLRKNLGVKVGPWRDPVFECTPVRGHNAISRVLRANGWRLESARQAGFDRTVFYAPIAGAGPRGPRRVSDSSRDQPFLVIAFAVLSILILGNALFLRLGAAAGFTLLLLFVVGLVRLGSGTLGVTRSRSRHRRGPAAARRAVVPRPSAHPLGSPLP